MADMPRLAVTREQAEQFYVVDRREASRNWTLRRGPLPLRLPERPTMPCPDCPPQGLHNIPIPEGARVEVGWWAPNEPDAIDGIVYHWSWHPVATATVDQVTKRITFDMDDDVLGEWTWLVTLTEIEVLDD